MNQKRVQRNAKIFNLLSSENMFPLKFIEDYSFSYLQRYHLIKVKWLLTYRNVKISLMSIETTSNILSNINKWIIGCVYFLHLKTHFYYYSIQYLCCCHYLRGHSFKSHIRKPLDKLVWDNTSYSKSKMCFKHLKFGKWYIVTRQHIENHPKLYRPIGAS